MTDKHIQKRTLTEFSITPSHGKRDTYMFHKSCQKLQDDGHYKCFICGSTENLEVHHFIEFSFEEIIDYNKMKELLSIFDFYGYSKEMIDEPITSVDDIRNLIVIDREHHRGVDHANNNSGIGIHSTTCPDWIIQRVCKDNENPIPQANETINDVEERIK